MKKITTAVLLMLSTIAFSQTPCSGGTANNFPCDGYDLMARITLPQMGASGANDSWGWTDPQDGKEYALVGLNNGTAFIDISQPTAPVYLGKLPTHTTNSTWRDMKVIGNYAYVVSEANGHGMQVFDLTELRDVNNPPVTFSETAHLDFFGDAHNIVSNPDTGYVYPVGTDLYQGGPVFVNVNDPLNPVVEGGYSSSAYSHDAQVVTYNGPDADHTGKEIMIGSNENEIVIVDITDKQSPNFISSINYTNVAYTHQGWFTEDQRYFILGDEGDEGQFGFSTRTLIFDFTDLDNPEFHFTYFGPTNAIDHNGYVVGDTYYLANYSAGMRAIDISDIENQNMTEVGYFDSYIPNNSTNFSGTWNVYPFFASGNIVMSGSTGFTLVRDATLGVEDADQSVFAMYPNPAQDKLTISSKAEGIASVQIYNVLGQQVISKSLSNVTSETIDISSLQTGMYLVNINNNTTKRLVVN